MLKFPCLVMDHDDTAVRSEETVNFPEFLLTLHELRPGVEMTREEFTRWCFERGYSAMIREQFGFTDEEADLAFRNWKAYVMSHMPPAYDGIREILQKYKQHGGTICVVSHSADANILRDYRAHFGLEPDLIYGWELGEELRKPNPYPLLNIMEKTGYAPNQLLMVDDLKPGYDMAKRCNVPFACAGWSHYIPEIKAFMQENCDYYLSNVQELDTLLFSDAK